MTLHVSQTGEIVTLVPQHPGTVFTTRLGGESRPPFDRLNLGYATGDDPEVVDRNRRRLSEALGIAPTWVTGRQVHGKGVMRARGSTRRRLPAADAVVIEEGGVVAAVLTADCVPVALHSGSSSAAVHAGWRGLCAGIIEESCHLVGEDRVAWIGPSIGPCHYEVGEEVPRLFLESHPGAPDVTSKVGDSLRFDLRAATRWLLEQSGCEVVTGDDVPCTFCDERFYSYRREGVTGRQGLLVWRS